MEPNQAHATARKRHIFRAMVLLFVVCFFFFFSTLHLLVMLSSLPLLPSAKQHYKYKYIYIARELFNARKFYMIELYYHRAYDSSAFAINLWRERDRKQWNRLQICRVAVEKLVVLKIFHYAAEVYRARGCNAYISLFHMIYNALVGAHTQHSRTNTTNDPHGFSFMK